MCQHAQSNLYIDTSLRLKHTMPVNKSRALDDMQMAVKGRCRIS
jgi:hypothetical protein